MNGAQRDHLKGAVRHGAVSPIEGGWSGVRCPQASGTRKGRSSKRKDAREDTDLHPGKIRSQEHARARPTHSRTQPDEPSPSGLTTRVLPRMPLTTTCSPGCGAASVNPVAW